MSLFDALADVETRLDGLSAQLADPDVVSDPNRYRDLMRDYKRLNTLVQAYREWKGLNEELGGAREMLAESDDELRSLAKAEISELEPKVEAGELRLKLLLLPADPNEGRDVILEIRAGVGGNEAGLFAADLFRMYTRFGEALRWKFDLISASSNDSGGYKEVIA